MGTTEKQDYWSRWLEIADKYSHQDDDDINESFVRALETKNEEDRKIAIDALIGLDDLYAASRIYWLVIHGGKDARLAAVEVLGRLCRDTMTLHTLVQVGRTDPSEDIRQATAAALEKLGIAVPNYSALF